MPELIAYAILTSVFVVTARLWIRRVKRSRVKKNRSQSRRRRGNSYDYRKHLAALVDRDGYVCKICGHTIDPFLRHPNPYSLSIDHIIPLSGGGTHDLDNLQLSHLLCNLQKGGAQVIRVRRIRIKK